MTALKLLCIWVAKTAMGNPAEVTNWMWRNKEGRRPKTTPLNASLR
jgi:hypothetical protein